MLKASPYIRLFWTAYQVNKTSSEYNVVFDQTISGRLDIARLKMGLHNFVANHILINSHMVETDTGEIFWEQNESIVSLQTFSSVDEECAFVEKPFVLETGPLYRFGLFRRDDGQYNFIIVLHHALIDGASGDEFLESISRYYNERRVAVNLKQQRDDIQRVVAELERRVNSLQHYGSEQFWQGRLNNLPANNELPYSRKLAGKIDNIGEYKFRIEHTARIQNEECLSRYSWFNKLAITWGVLIARYADNPVAYVNYPISIKEGRALKYGCHVNTLIFPINVTNAESFLTLLQREETFIAQCRLEDGLKHSHFPSLDILNSAIIRSSNVSCAQTSFKSKVFEFNGCNVKANNRYSIDLAGAELAFEYEKEEEKKGNSFNFKIKYRADLFSAEQIKRMAEHFEVLLNGVHAEPDKPLQSISILTALEYQQIVCDWNDTTTDYPRDKTIPQLFNEQVQRTPDAIAIIYEENELVYAELQDKVQHVSNLLQQRYYNIHQKCMPADTIIAVCMERSIELVITLLAVLDAGAAYLPLDLDYPEERLRYMLDDSQPAFVIYQQILQEEQSWLCANDYSTVSIESLLTSKHIVLSPDASTAARVSSKDLMYVMYTSGSTGQPKGVLLEYRGIVNRILWMQSTFFLDASDRILQKTPYNFDVSVWEFFWPLMVGSALVIAEPNKHREPDYLLDMIAREKISTLHFVPAMFEAFLNLIAKDDVNKEKTQSLKNVFVSGEVLNRDIVDRFFDCCDASLFNLYGATEASIGVSAYACRDLVHSNLSIVSIGKPISNCQLYILDKHLHPLPVSVAGELYIGGEGVARGYLNKPDLTAERFIENPFVTEAEHQAGHNLRLYKTGDKCRWLSDGNIAYIGRADFQVKLRGFRIELGEIESQLQAHALVSQTVVILSEDEASQYLVAYAVLAEAEVMSSASTTIKETLQSWLRERLPDYMVPSVIMVLDALPLTSNGKIDRKALPAPDWSGVSIEDYIAPSNTIEQALVTAWESVLNVERVGVHDDFFALGGDSIMSIQVLSRVRQAGLHLTVQQLFQAPRIADLALLAADAAEQAAIDLGVDSGEVGLTPIQAYFFGQAHGNYHHYNQSSLLRLHADIDLSCLCEALYAAVSVHSGLRLRYRQDDEVWQQYYVDASDAELLPIEDVMLPAGDADVHNAFIESSNNEVQSSLDIEAGPVARAVLYTGHSDGRSRLFIVIHHLMVDGVSWRILLDDVQTAYQQLVSKAPLSLPVATSHFSVWSRGLQRYAKSEGLLSQGDYWLAHVSQHQSFPVDHEYSGVITAQDMEHVRFSLSKTLTRQLLQSSLSAYNLRIEEFLLSGLLLGLSRWRDCASVVIDVEGHGREDCVSGVDVSRTVGWFTSIYPVQLSLPVGESITLFDRVLKLVKETVRGIPDKGLAFGVWRYLRDDAVAKQLRTHTSALVFNYLGQMDSGRVRGGDALWEGDTLSQGRTSSVENVSGHVLALNGWVSNGQFGMTLSYSKRHYDAESAASLVTNYQSALEELTAYCSQTDVQGYTPSDFPYTALTQAEVDVLTADSRVQQLYPLSPLQSGMLFHHLYNPVSDLYCTQAHFHYGLDVDVAALCQAWSSLVARHAILRTAFIWEGIQQPIQVVYSEVELPWQEEDWSTLSRDAASGQLDAYYAADRVQGFILSEPCVMRLHLIRLLDGYTCVWSHHHILTDGWSSPLILRDLNAYYRHYAEGNALQLPEVVDYRRYIDWLYCQDMAAAEDFWQEQLSALDAPTHLPYHTQHMDVRAGDAEQHHYSYAFTVEFMQKCEAFIKRHRLTLNTLVQYCWGIVLSRYVGDAHALFGLTVSGRSSEVAGIEGMVGLFINTLPLRVDVDADATVLDGLFALQQRIQQVNQYSYVGLDTVQQQASWSNALGLFSSISVFENYPTEKLATARQQMSGVEKANYPLTLAWLARKDLRLHIKYAVDMFSESQIEQLVQHITHTLRWVVEHEGAELSALSMLTAAEYQRIVYDWNQTATDYPRDKTIPQLFTEQVAKTPDSVALSFEECQLTYAELQKNVQHVSAYLQQRYYLEHKQALPKDTIMGVCMERSLELVITLLGILDAGAAYLPLDPDYPTARLEYMVSDSAPALVLCQAHLQVQCSWLQSTQYWVQGIEDILLARKMRVAAKAKTRSRLSADDLAYVIYTSGSTGMPKGVMVEHCSVVNLLVWLQKKYNLDTSDRLLQKTSYSFDPSVRELFWPLLSGAELVMAAPGLEKDMASLRDVIASRGITVFGLVPALLKVFLESVTDSKTQDKLSSLRYLIVGGEALSRSIIDVYTEHGHATILNVYGPTETTIDVSAYDCRDVLTRDLAIAPIGKPIANAQLYILDDYLQVVPMGIAGELHIGGSGLARGYLNKPELTAERFIANPFVTEAERAAGRNLRLYKTGDVCCWLADGNIAYIGRADFQVKLRGFRIELGEIERQLEAHEAVRQAVVILSDEKCLVGYIVSAQAVDDEAALHGELQAWLGAHLPAYMVPSLLIVLDALPLTSNGKIDRKGLPAPDWSGMASTEEYVAPSNTIEQALVTAWESVLNVERVGVHDDFFALGGDSIMSIQVISRLREANIHLTVQQLFQVPRIVDLALLAAEAAEQAAIDMGKAEGEVALTPIQARFFETPHGAYHHYNQSMFLCLSHDVDIILFSQTITRVFKCHSSLRLRYRRAPAGWQQYYVKNEDAPSFIIEEIVLPATTSQKQAIYMTAHNQSAQGRLDITQGPVARVLLYTGHVDSCIRVFMVIHHLMVDGVSWRLLLEDIGQAYHQLQQGEALSLPAATSHFSAWSVGLCCYAESELLSSQREYWLNQVSTSSTLPVDHAHDGVVRQADVATLYFTLDAATTSQLLRDVHGAYHTRIEEFLISALVLGLYRWRGCESVVLDMEGHGREDCVAGVDVSRTVGWFTSVYPVRFALPLCSEAARQEQVLTLVKEALRAVPDKGLGFGVWRYLRDDDVSQVLNKHQGQMVFNYLGQMDSGTHQLNSQGTGLWRYETVAQGAASSGDTVVEHPLALNGFIRGGCLQMTLSYSKHHYDAESAEAFIACYQSALEELIAYCCQADVHGYTPSDFPYTQLTQVQVDGLTADNCVQQLYPLSPLQSGMLFHHLYNPASDLYCTQLHFHYGLDIDVAALRQAWSSLASRHAILRTAFAWEGLQRPIQVMYDGIELPWHEEDWGTLSREAAASQLDTYYAADRARGFDLQKPSVMRLHLIRLADGYTCVWSHHHILTDGWSSPLILRDLNAYYRHYAEGNALQLPEVVDYRRYVDWLYTQDVTVAKAFWSEQLAGLEAPTHLPYQIQHSDVRAGDAEQHHYSYAFTAEVMQVCDAFIKRHRLTLNTLVQYCWGIVLSRYVGDAHALFGLTVSGRSSEVAGIEGMVGLFINTLPLRVDVDADATVLDGLFALQQRIQQVNQYSYVGLDTVQQQAPWPNELGLFSSISVFENYPTEELSTSRQQISGVEKAHYPLTLIWSAGAGLQLHIKYAVDMFTEAQVVQLTRHFEHALSWFIEHETSRHREFSLMTATEYQQIVYDWNDTTTDYPRDKTIPQLFDEQAQRTPDAIAVSFEDNTLSYAALQEKVQYVSQVLQQHYYQDNKTAIPADTIVAVYMLRSIELVITLLAIMDAGAAYLPLDPDYPAARLEYMLEDSQPALIVCQAALQHDCLWLRDSAYPVKSIESLLSERNAQFPAEAARVSPVTIHDLAYVMYTSGSTGKPKGVMVEQGNILNTLFWMRDYYQLSENINFLQKTTYCFDVSVPELFLPLLLGGKITLLKPGREHDVVYIQSIINEQQVTDVSFVPSMLVVFLEVAKQHTIEYMTWKRIYCLGEVLSKDVCELCKDVFPDVRLDNMYGPTEAAIYASCFKMTGCYHNYYERSVPIGKAFNNVCLYILNQHQQPAPIGIAGELYIGGEGVARGYLNKDALTAERFIANPFVTEAERAAERNLRLYKTGDKCRWLADGNIEYIGRADFQVKLRGFRIELGEIERQVEAYEFIKQSVIILNEEQGNPRLVGYVVTTQAADDEAALSAELQTWLRERLPDHMMPSLFIVLDALPLTSNGKVDRKTLPKPDWSGVVSMEAYVAPRDAIEEVLVSVWASVLSVECVGVMDDFFALGGHSLLAIRLSLAIQSHFSITYPVTLIFKQPRLSMMAEYIRHVFLGGDDSTAELGLPALTLSTAEPATYYPLSTAQQRLWFLDAYEGGNSATYNVPYRVHLEGELDVAALRSSFAYLLSRHAILRTHYGMEDNLGCQYVADEMAVYFIERAIDESALADVLHADMHTAFSLSTGPLLKVYLYRLSETSHVLLMNQHHSITDGWSLGLLLRELSVCYSAYAVGDAPALAPLQYQHVDYAVSEAAYIADNHYVVALDYWRGQLADTPVLDLPTDYPRPLQKQYAGATYTFELGNDIAASAQQLTTQTHSTLFMVMLSAFMVLLQRYSGQDDIVVGAPVANRQHADVASMLGFFVNTLALRTQFVGDETFIDVIERVKATCLSAYGYQALPFEYLVDALDVVRDTSRPPLCQVMFTMQHADDGATLSLPGLQVHTRGESGEFTVSKFDLTLNLHVHNDGISCGLNYDTALFAASTIARMATHFEVLLQDLLSHADRAIDSVQMLTAEEYQRIVYDWNQTATDYPRDKTIPGLFAEQVAKTPDAIAVSFQDNQLTYAELQKNVQHVSAYLQQRYYLEHKQALPKDTIMGVCMARSLELVITLLGILDAGAAYLPLDPDYPAARLEYMVSDSAPALVLCQGALQVEDFWLQDVSVDVVTIDSILSSRKVRVSAKAQTHSRVSTHDLAYVMYTSGSTGLPKGVMVEHIGVVNELLWMLRTYSLDEHDRILQVAPYSFDISVWELFLPLISGAATVMCEVEHYKEPEYLQRIIYKEQVTTLQLVPTMLDMFIKSAMMNEQASDELLTTLRRVFVIGEALHQDVAKQFAQYHSAELYNFYGPTEASIGVSIYDCRNNSCSELGIMPIGKPIANCQLYILDIYLHPTVLGVAGELYIGGECLARGYLNRDDLTAERFIVNPFVSEEERAAGRNLRLYKTGDVCRWLADGNIAYISRADFQVKLRGFRIELGEIERQLESHEAIQQAVVILSEEKERPCLIGYIVSAEAVDDNVDLSAELQTWLGECLPDYMVPSVIMVLDALPLTSNGKLDRKALPAPDWSGVNTEDYVAPRNAIEQTLVDIWQSILKIECVGVYDDFFTLGGDSIMSIQIISRIRELGYYLTVQDLFKTPRIVDLANTVSQKAMSDITTINMKALEQQHIFALNDLLKQCCNTPKKHQSSKEVLSFIPYETVNEQNDQIIFMLPPGHGGAESYYANLIPKLNNRRLIVFNNIYLVLQRELNRQALSKLTIEHLAAYYIAHIKQIQPQGPYKLLGWSIGGMIAFEIAKQLVAAGEKVKNIFMIDTHFQRRLSVQETNAKHEREEHKDAVSSLIDNYYHTEKVDLNGTKITLFKADKSEQQSSNDNIEKSEIGRQDNYLLEAVEGHVNIVPIEASHFDWVERPSIINKIVSFVLNK